MLSVDDVKKELGIDFSDNNIEERLKRYITLAEAWLSGAVGDYDKNDERAKQLALLIIEDLFDRNSNTVKENATINKLKNDFVMQLKWGPKKNGSI